MFEAMREQVERLAARRAKATAAELNQRLRDALPRGIEAEPVEEGVRLRGRGLRRRLALDPALRWMRWQ